MITLFGEEEYLPGEPDAVPQSASTAASARSGSREKQYYTIGEVAKIFDVRPSHIRFWTGEFALKVRTTRKGDRLYTSADIEELRTIYHLVKERGYTISGAKAKLKEGVQPAIDKLHLKETLLALRNQLLLIRNELL